MKPYGYHIQGFKGRHVQNKGRKGSILALMLKGQFFMFLLFLLMLLIVFFFQLPIVLRKEHNEVIAVFLGVEPGMCDQIVQLYDILDRDIETLNQNEHGY